MQLGSLCSGPIGVSTDSLALGGLGLRQLNIDSCTGSLDGHDHALEVDGRRDGMPAVLRADDLNKIPRYPVAGIARLRPPLRDV